MAPHQREREPGDDDEPPPPDDRHAPQSKTGAARPATPTAISSVWRPLDPSWLTERPPPRRWLLRRPTLDGRPAPPSLGDGLLPLGKVGLLVADGGVGKTMTLVALAISVITGRPWLEYYHVPIEVRDGRVLLVLAEEDRDEVHRRLYSAAQAYDLSDHERARVAMQLVVLYLAGQHVALMSEAGAPSSELLALRERLEAESGDQGWALLALDPFSRFAAPDSELDNAVATRTIQAAETLVSAPGGPTVLIAHHAPQVALSGGGTVRARGVTGIRDAARWEATLRADGPDVWFRQSKSNYSMPMQEDLRLVRGPGGLLRAATDAEEEARQERRQGAQDERQADKDAKREGRISGLCRALVEALALSEAPVTSQKQLARMVPGNSEEREEAVVRLLASGRVAAPEKQRQGYRVVEPRGQMDLSLPTSQANPEAQALESPPVAPKSPPVAPTGVSGKAATSSE